MKGRGVTLSKSTTENGLTLAISDSSQWDNLRSGCEGHDNNTIVTGSTGQRFQVLCDTRHKGDNYDPAKRPSYPSKHTQTLDECLQYCSDGSPFCWGVLFSPTQQSGYKNCYAKTANATNNKNDWVEQKDMITAYALESINTTCSGASYTSPNGANFNTSCDHSGESPDIEKLHAANFEECQDLCADYKPDSGNAACKGVVYQPSARDGWLNCGLKYGVTNITTQAEYHLAILATQGSGGNSSSSSSSKAWIAGAVVGPLVILGLIAGLFFWYRRRRNSSKHVSGGPFQQQTSQERMESQPFKQGYPMQDQQHGGNGSPYLAAHHGSMSKHDYAQAPSTPRNVPPAEMGTETTRGASELPVGPHGRHEMPS